MKLGRSIVLSAVVSLCPFGAISAKEYKKITLLSQRQTQKMIRMDVEKKMKITEDGTIHEGFYKREVKVRCRQVYDDGSALFDGTSQLLLRSFVAKDKNTGAYHDEFNELNEESNILIESVCPTIHFQFLVAENGAIIAQHLTQAMKGLKEIEGHPKFKELLKKTELQESTKRTRQKKIEPEHSEESPPKKEPKKTAVKEQLNKKFRELYEKLEEEDPYFLPPNIADEFLPLFREKPKKKVTLRRSFSLVKDSCTRWKVMDATSEMILLEGKGTPHPIVLEEDRGILYQKEKRQVVLEAKTGHLLSQKIVFYTSYGADEERCEWVIKVLR